MAQVRPASASQADVLVSRVNAERVNAGVPPLSVDPRLTAIAEQWSNEMARVGNYFHNPDMAAELPPTWLYRGENVGAEKTLDEAHQAFMASAVHRSEILDPRYQLLGVGVAPASDGGVWVTEDFMTLRPPPPPAALPVVTVHQQARHDRTVAAPTTAPAPPSPPVPVRSSVGDVLDALRTLDSESTPSAGVVLLRQRSM